MQFDLESIRSQFPALAITDGGKRRIYFDNPAGTQVPLSVAEAMSDCLLSRNANLGGNFASSDAADEVVRSARDAAADFINAPSADEIVFGQNMTTMTLHLSRSIGRSLRPGDEVIVTRMDHDANVWPWVLMAQDFGLEVRWLPFNNESFEFDLDEFDELLNDHTRLVCVGGASNLTGTINDVAAISAKAKAAGALTFIDAVQSAPHVATDVQQIGCDFFICSAYKFFGPHQGILWGRREVLESLQPYKVRPAADEIPWCFETGTQSHEGFAGITATVNYIASVAEMMPGDYTQAWTHFSGRRQQVHASMDCMFEYEKTLASHLLNGLAALNGVTVQGISAPGALDRRVPTVSFTHDTVAPKVIAATLAKENIFVWHGHNYAVEPARSLGLYESGGVLRVGPVHYNSIEEIDELLAVLRTILQSCGG